jgi:hypothetical protein
MNAEGLFPKRTQGWLLLAILTLLFYWTYYFDLYHQLSTRYQTMFYNDTVKDDQVNVRIAVRSPQFVSETVERTITVSITNLNDTPIDSLKIVVSPIEGDQHYVSVSTVKSNLGFSTAESGNFLPNYIEFQNIPARATVAGIFQIYVGDVPEKTVLTLEFYRDDVSLSRIQARMTVDRQKAFQHSLIEAILLPPWSNGLLVVIALLIVKLVEDWMPGEQGSGIRDAQSSSTRNALGYYLQILPATFLVIAGHSLFFTLFLINTVAIVAGFDATQSPTTLNGLQPYTTVSLLPTYEFVTSNRLMSLALSLVMLAVGYIIASGWIGNILSGFWSYLLNRLIQKQSALSNSKCPKFGLPIQSDASFCPHCGSQVVKGLHPQTGDSPTPA